jgi:transcriptional regulator with XRE-family HTH domain
MPDPASQPSNIFAARLDRLFRTVTKPDRTEYTYEEVQEGSGRAVTAAYIWRLRTGKAKNPGYSVIKALSDFFQVEPNYFFLDDDTVDRMLAQAKITKRLQEEDVETIALRASELDEAGRHALLGMIDYIRQLKVQREQ